MGVAAVGISARRKWESGYRRRTASTASAGGSGARARARWISPSISRARSGRAWTTRRSRRTGSGSACRFAGSSGVSGLAARETCAVMGQARACGSIPPRAGKPQTVADGREKQQTLVSRSIGKASNAPSSGLLKNPRFCGSVFRYPLAREGNIRDVGTQEPRPDGIVRHRFARTLDSRRSHPGPREPGSGLELAARGGIGLLLRGQRPSGDRPGSGGSLDVGGSSAGVRARPSVDARGAGEPRDPVVHGGMGWRRSCRTIRA